MIGMTSSPFKKKGTLPPLPEIVRGCHEGALRRDHDASLVDDRPPRKTEMTVFPIPSNKSLSSIIAAHRRARARKMQLERRRSAGFSLFVYPLVWLAQRLERRAYRQFAVDHPTDREDARKKLVYLMAVVIADRTNPGATEITSAIETLRPHKAALAEYLQRQRSSPANDQR